MSPRRLILPLLILLASCAVPATASASSLGQAQVTSSQRDHTRLDLGDVSAGASRSGTATVTNTGTSRLAITIDGFGLSGGDASSFAVTGGTCKKGAQVAGGSSCTLVVTFAPRRVGVLNTTLHVNARDARGDDASASGFVVKGHGNSDCTDSSYSPTRDRSNPLELSPNVHTAGASNPLQGAKFFVDRHKGLAVPYLSRHPSLHKIADQPENKRFSRYTAGGSPHGVESNVHKFLCRVHDEGPGSIPTTSIYRIHHDHCGHAHDSRREQNSYKSWINGLVRGIGRQPIVVFYEFDALITVGCLSHSGLNARIGELRYGIKKLSALPHTVVYIDAGAADALSSGRVARLLNKVGIGPIQGFFLNSTHYDWTSNEVAYGNKVSRLVHGKHFVVSTSVNGRGPLRPRSRVHGGNEVLCNPPGRGLGIRPTTNTGKALADGFLWIGNAGLSGGKCHRGDVGNGRFFLRYALGLVSRASEQYGPHTARNRY